jgi:hypothetical protein
MIIGATRAQTIHKKKKLRRDQNHKVHKEKIGKRLNGLIQPSTECTQVLHQFVKRCSYHSVTVMGMRHCQQCVVMIVGKNSVYSEFKG